METFIVSEVENGVKLPGLYPMNDEDQGRATRPGRRKAESAPVASQDTPMFFVLSKILGFFAIPSNLVIALGLVGAVAAVHALCARRLCGS